MNAPVHIGQSTSLADLTDARLCERIEGFVKEAGGGLFHRPSWIRAVEAGTGHRATGIVTQQMGAVTGWLPLTEVRSFLFGRTLVSSGFGVGGGILAENKNAARALALAAENHAMRYGFSSVELRGGEIPEGWQSWDNRHCDFARELAEDDESELLAIPRHARAEVRKGLRKNLEVRIGSSTQDLDAFFAMYSASVRNLGTPVFPKRLFASMLEAFSGQSDILTILHDGTPVSAVFSFYNGKAVSPYWGGGVFEARKLHANELGYYKLMCHARSRGMQRFDFGRSKTGSGPYRFKKNWGLEPVPLTYGEWIAPGASARDVDPLSEANRSRIALWKKLPLPVANLVGPLIARDLA